MFKQRSIFSILFLIYLLFFISSQNIAHSQNIINKKKLRLNLISQVSVYSVSVVGMNYLWYKDYPRTKFHFFDDSHEWLQIDKAGHAYTTYYLTNILTNSFKNAGIDNNKSVLFSSGLGFMYMMSIEAFDGFSPKWGASYTDLAANAVGILIYSSQEILWREQKIIPKFSFHTTGFPKYRPEMLGNSFAEMLLKDYNGQTYWLSFNTNSLTKLKVIPDWFNVAIGYSAEGMLGGEKNPLTIDGRSLPYFERKRQFYFSFDIDFNRIKTNKKFLKYVFKFANCIKFPFPAIEIEKKGLSFYPLYF